jgi:hypothetical protein
MEATFSQKSDAKKQHSPTPEPLAEAQFSSEMEQGATAGVPLFLQRLPVQPKLVVGQPNDPLEQEADRVAERVQSGSHQSAQTTSTEADSVQRKCAKCEEKVQAKSLGTIAASSSSLPLPDAGSALSKEVRSRVEPILGADLSHVRVHNSPSAQATAKDLNATAFTHKNHIWLGANQSPNDIALLSHEATHVVQQTGHENESPLVQRVVVDPAVEDGAEVQRRLRQRIDEALGTRSPTPAPAPNNTPNAATPANAPATVDPETRRAAQQVDQSELAAKTTEVQPDARPSVDRAAEQQPQVEAAAKTTEESLDKPPEEKAEGEGKEAGQGEKKGGAEKAAVAAANQAASIADQAFSMADSQSLPDQPAQVVPPTPIAPVDAGGMPLPDHPEMDEQLFALANQAQELREQGQNQRAHATEGTANTRILRGNLQLVQQSIGQSESGVQKAQGHLEFRRGLLNQAQQALTISEQKAANLTQQAPEGVSQAASGQEKSGSLASESRDLAGQNNANTPDDPEAAQKSQEQGSKLNQVGSDAASIDDTLTQVHTASNTLVQDAAHATQVNTQTCGRVAGMEATLQQTDASLSAMQEQNSQARSQLDAVQEQPALLKAEATGMDAEGQDMIATSLDIEARIHQAQQNHAAGMQTVPAVEQPQEEMQAIPAEEASEPQAIETPPVAEQSVATVLEPPASAAMQVPETELMPAESAPSQEAAIQKPETSPVTEPASAAIQVPETELMSAESAPGEEVIIQPQVATTTASPQAEATPPQPANINIARGLPSWVTGEPEPNAAERQAAQEREEARRQQEIDEINAIANERGGFDRLTTAERRRIAFRLAMRNTFGGISNISWPGLGGIARGAGHLAAGLIDPRAPLMGVVSGVNMIINGVVNFGRQPSWIGALRLAANVATGLTIILGSITALAGVIAALMTAITIVTLGTAAPFTGPIIAFCATIMSTVGGWTFWVGLIAAALQALTFVADLWQAGTAQTADQLQQQSETMTEDARNAGNSLLQAGMGKLAQVGGRQMQSAIAQAGGGVRFAAQMGAGFQAGARSLPGRISSGVKALPGRISSGVKALPGRISSGVKALPGRIVGGTRALGTRAIGGARALPGRIAGGVRSLGSAARALPGRIVQAPGQLVRGIRSLPGRLRQQLSQGFSRNFLIGEDITSLGGAKAATAEARAAVFEASEARSVTSGTSSAAETPRSGEVAEVRPTTAEGEVSAPKVEEPSASRRADGVAEISETSPETAPAREASIQESGHIESDQLSRRQVRNEVEHLTEHPERIEGAPPNRRARIGDHEWQEQSGGGWCRLSRKVCFDADELRSLTKSEVDRLIAAATEEEPKVTAALSDIADSNAAEMVGLENRLKTAESLSRKIGDRASARAARGQGASKAVAAEVERINDALRYTYRIDGERYIDVYQRTIAELESRGFQHVKDFNAWERAGTTNEFAYRGINSTFRSPNGQLFELQFHTTETLAMKNELHGLYEEWRAAMTSAARRQEIEDYMLHRWRAVPVPPGAAGTGMGGLSKGGS